MTYPTTGERLKLSRRRISTATTATSAEPTRPPVRRGKLLICCGNSGEDVGLRLLAHAWRDGYDLPAIFINNDHLGPTPLQVHVPGRGSVSVTATDRFVLGAEGNTRDLIKEYPLLVKRYLEGGLLRGVPVFETYNRGGRGGHAIPTITVMDIDLHIEALYGHLRRSLQWLSGEPQRRTAASDLEILLTLQNSQQEASAESWIIVVPVGGTGSCGNGCAQTIPYLIRHILHELGIRNYELWLVVLGPRAFTGLTAYVQHNYLALLHSLDYMAEHGQRRAYLNGITIDTDAPPCDRLFLLDDPLLPSQGASVTEQEMQRFLDRAALSLHLLLNTDAYDVIASHAANPLDLTQDQRIRWLHTVNGTVAGVEREGLLELVTQTLEARLLERFMTRLAS
ncbi:MAG: hypothetical protein H0T73_12610 [Ardenticatenales bacterium]|nr:hypothetical protein [Ardenticatenales bacterium]